MAFNIPSSILSLISGASPSQGASGSSLNPLASILGGIPGLGGAGNILGSSVGSLINDGLGTNFDWQDLLGSQVSPYISMFGGSGSGSPQGGATTSGENPQGWDLNQIRSELNNADAERQQSIREVGQIPDPEYNGAPKKGILPWVMAGSALIQALSGGDSGSKVLSGYMSGSKSKGDMDYENAKSKTARQRALAQEKERLASEKQQEALRKFQLMTGQTPDPIDTTPSNPSPGAGPKNDPNTNPSDDDSMVFPSDPSQLIDTVNTLDDQIHKGLTAFNEASSSPNAYGSGFAQELGNRLLGQMQRYNQITGSKQWLDLTNGRSSKSSPFDFTTTGIPVNY